VKEDSFSFSLSDFLAYVFPGTLLLLAVTALLRLSPFKHLLTEVPLNIVTGLMLAACAYVAGASLSSLMVSVERYLDMIFKFSNPTNSIQLKGFEDEVQKAFDDIFGKHGVWSANHFYIARALIREKMPYCAAVIDRQDSLRQIRRNSVLPILFLGLAGVGSGIKVCVEGTFYLWGVGIILISLLSSCWVVKSIIKNGMHSNRRREVREVCSSLLAYHSQANRGA